MLTLAKVWPVLTLAVLAACGPTLTHEQYEAQLDDAWTKPGAAPGDAHADRVACGFEIEKATAGLDFGPAVAKGRAMWGDCMAAKGWTPAQKP